MTALKHVFCRIIKIQRTFMKQYLFKRDLLSFEGDIYSCLATFFVFVLFFSNLMSIAKGIIKVKSEAGLVFL